MLAHILREAGENPTAVIGSIVRDFGSNFVLGRDDLFVVEACEWKDHLLHLSPEILVITNIEFEHADHFRDLEAVQYTFRRAVEAVPDHGAIITDPKHPTIIPVLRGVRACVIDYTQEVVPDLQQVGEFNRENARAAKAAAKAACPAVKDEACNTALASFQGAWRRFEFKGETPRGALVYDDYAHTPTGIRRTIEGVRERFPDKKIVVAFHPHTYSRTKGLFDDFAKALVEADKAYILPIFAAREKFDPTISHHSLAAACEEYGGHIRAVDSFEELETLLLDEEGSDSLIITMGAGDVYKVAEMVVGE
jgi:UDP-N-acetylmuramate--alanine ligase